jgi:quercetin dioxygenase-like cupin family protein
MQGIDKFPDFITALPELDLPFPGARGWLLQGERQQVVFLEFDEDAEVPEHTHDEQWEFALTDKVVLHRDGAATEHQAGDNFFIPAGVPHAGDVKAGYKAMIVFNAPDRYKPKK